MVENDKNRIEDVKRRLYDPNDSLANRRKEGVLHPVNREVPRAWQAPTLQQAEEVAPSMKKPPVSIYKKFFIGAVVFFVAALGFAAYMFTSGGTSVSSDNIDIKVLGNAFTKGGEELPLSVEITNRNNANLELADLVVEYPRGASDKETDVIRIPRDTIGTIKKGQSVTRNIKVTLFGDEKSVRTIKLSLNYHPEGSNAIFTKEKEYGVTISSAPLSLLLDAPTTATSDQIITLNVTATLNTTLPDTDTMLQLSYPPNFVFDSAVPAPSLGNSLWSLSSLTQTTPLTISVKGKLVGQDGDQQVFHAYAGTTSPTDKTLVDVVYNSLLQTVTITKPFLETHILVNNQDLPTYTANGGSQITGEVSWVNNLPTRVTDAKIILNLAGNAFDKLTVNPMDGFFDSANSRIIWDKNTTEDLASVEPGARGVVNFTLKPLSLVGATTQLKEPQVTMNVSIAGKQPSLGSIYADVNNFSTKVVKILSDFQIATSASFVDGPLPPKAETESKYSITWTLSNSANTITNGQAKAVLPIYVSWGGTAGGTGESVGYNATTREVTWNIGTVRPNTGFDSNREVTFDVILKPSLSQVGSVPQLIKDVYLSGMDTYTGTVVKNSRGPLTTLLTNDSGFKYGNERVIK